MTNIMKFLDSISHNKGQTHYLFHPERIVSIHDTATGCRLIYEDFGRGEIEGFSARQIKRSIQEQVDEPMGFLKTEYVWKGHTGVHYFNVQRVLSIISVKPEIVNNKEQARCHMLLDYSNGAYTILHPAQDVAYQIKRVLKRLDQDQELCCAPEEEAEEE